MYIIYIIIYIHYICTLYIYIYIYIHYVYIEITFQIGYLVDDLKSVFVSSTPASDESWTPPNQPGWKVRSHCSAVNVFGGSMIPSCKLT